MSEQRQVWSTDGVRGVIVSGDLLADGQELRVRLDDGRELLVPASLLELRTDGTYLLPATLADTTSLRTAADGRQVIPVLEEELAVSTREHSRTVRVHKHVHTREETVEVPVHRDEVVVERVPIDRVVETAPQVRRDGDTMVVPVLEEVLVVEKRLMLKEEIRITLRRTAETNPQRVVLRSEEVVVERDDESERVVGDPQRQGES